MDLDKEQIIPDPGKGRIQIHNTVKNTVITGYFTQLTICEMEDPNLRH